MYYPCFLLSSALQSGNNFISLQPQLLSVFHISALTGAYDTVSPFLTPSSWGDDSFPLLFITRFLIMPFPPRLSLLYCYLKFCSFFMCSLTVFLIRTFSIRPESRLFIALFPVMAQYLAQKRSSGYFLNEERWLNGKEIQNVTNHLQK